MTDFARGQKGKLADMGCSGAFTITLDIPAQGMEIDIACFGLDMNDKLSDDRFMVFFNQKSCPGDAVTLDMSHGKSIFHTDVSRLPDSICKLVFAASMSGDGTMRNISSSSIRLGSAAFHFSGADFQDEKDVIVAEVYKRDGVWRFGAVGQGFKGGLSALLKHFGGSEAQSTPQPEPKKVSLSKITLEKKGDKVSLEKTAGRGFGRICVNLNWNQSSLPVTKPKNQGFLSKIMGSGPTKSSGGIDLDLGCMYQLTDGSAGAVQALGNSWGSYTQPPFIHLKGDDRSGSNVDGEDLFINGDELIHIKRILIFAFIYDGAPNWATTNGLVTIKMPGQAQVDVRLDNGTNAPMCAIAMLENIAGKLQVTKIVEYFEQIANTSAHELMNNRFDFGLRFKQGSKD